MSVLAAAAHAARDWRLPFLLVVLGWSAALAFSTFSARVLFGDGALYVLVNLQQPSRFNDYDFQRTFASLIAQAPVLLGQRIGVREVEDFAALYSLGVFGVPAAAMIAALYLSRSQPGLFAIIAVAIPVFGFGVNFINSETNIYFGLVWLAAALLALPGLPRWWRGLALPLIALALLRTYEGMLLVGPVFAAWAFLEARESTSARDQVGLGLAAFLFMVGAIIGLGGVLSPRDPGNSLNFLKTGLQYLANPQAFILASGVAALAAVFLPVRSKAFAGCALVSLLAAAGFLVAMTRLSGYFAYGVYYQNRGLLVLSLPFLMLALFLVHRFRPGWLLRPLSPYAYAPLLIPITFAIAADMQGTARWRDYVARFCAVLGADAAPAERLTMLTSSGVMTGWPWTHPTLSVLLRGEQSGAMVVNPPGQYEPFDHRSPAPFYYRGLCAGNSFAIPREEKSR